MDLEVRLRVVTGESVARWIAGGDEDPARRPSLLSRDLVRTLADDLARSARGRCTVQVGRPGE